MRAGVDVGLLRDSPENEHSNAFPSFGNPAQTRFETRGWLYQQRGLLRWAPLVCGWCRAYYDSPVSPGAPGSLAHLTKQCRFQGIWA